MGKLKKYIPIWIKEPIYVFLKESKTIPPSIAREHALCNFAENIKWSDEKKEKYYKRMHKKIYKYLEDKYSYVFSDFPEYSAGVKVDNAPIWLFWWQGKNGMPEIVANCTKSILSNCGKHQVILITKDNYNEYINLPQYILDKIKDKTITLTHFSDILRVNLIAEHGGYWLDATIFCTSLIKEEVFERPIYTGRNPGKDFRNISQWRWTGYAISGWKNNALFCYMRDLFNEYWRQEACLIDYYLIDYMICLVYNNSPLVKKIIDNIETNNVEQNLLQQELNAPYSYEKFNYILNNGTWLYKLTWKQKYNLYTDQREESIYNRWCQYINEL